jgi:hypothetical protein
MTDQIRIIGMCRKCRKHHSELVLIMPEGNYKQLDGSLREPVRCCGRVVVMRRVKGEYNPKIPCNAKCLMGKSLDCSCSCGGLNHGKGHSH